MNTGRSDGRSRRVWEEQDASAIKRSRENGMQ